MSYYMEVEGVRRVLAYSQSLLTMVVRTRARVNPLLLTRPLQAVLRLAAVLLPQ